jgi:hypothetical protein
MILLSNKEQLGLDMDHDTTQSQRTPGLLDMDYDTTQSQGTTRLLVIDHDTVLFTGNTWYTVKKIYRIPVFFLPNLSETGKPLC